jgi:nitrite reductase (NO-forming)
MIKRKNTFPVILILMLILSACVGADPSASAEYILTTAISNGEFVFMGVNGSISGLVNPILRAQPGEEITIMLVNSGEGEHDIVLPDINVHSGRISKKGETVSVTFFAPQQSITLEYYDSIHERLGMRGLVLVGVAEALEENVNSLAANPAADDVAAEAVQSASASTSSAQTVAYTLESAMVDGKMVFIGKGGEIDGQINPDLTASAGDTLTITLFSGEGALHNFALDEFNVLSEDVMGQGSSVVVEFTADMEGTFAYYCAVPGHRQAGMEGELIIGTGQATQPAQQNHSASMEAASDLAAAPASVEPADAAAADIVRDPTDLPGPISNRGPETIRIDLETVELSGQLADGTTYRYWTFNKLVPGPFIRVRVGDTLEVHLTNADDSSMFHSVDFHAVTGPGGGAVATQTQPGGETMFTFKALNPGLFVYHCATPMVSQHIANGMYGLILVEPEGGLPAVNREFYVMQGELYTAQPFGTPGNLTEDTTSLLDENPQYFILNGASMALASDAHALHAQTGETVRIFFGVGGPNFTSSFHVIGEIFDRVYEQASLTSDPLTDVQTTLVPPGGATMVEFALEVPGRYILVDHALARMERGLAGFLYVDGEPMPEIFDGEITPGSGH